MLTAILFVTVLVVELDTAVDTKAFPVVAGNVTVVEAAIDGAVKVSVPEVSPVIIIELMFFPKVSFYCLLASFVRFAHRYATT